MGNNASRRDPRNARSQHLARNRSGAEHEPQHETGTGQRRQGTTAFLGSASAGESAAAQPSALYQQQQQEPQQRSRQQSTWSLGSLSGRLNWSFTGASRSSFHNRTKSTTRKSFSSVQQRRSKTTWHRPLTNAIFSSHFKETSRNEQFHIDRLVAKGAFGVVFKVIDKQRKQQPHSTFNGTVKGCDEQLVYALKVLKKSKIIEENSVQQIKEEADIQKLCGHHPFIVQQIDLWQNRRNLHILSEYVPNGELFSKIITFSIDLIRLYLAEIALAIDFLHNAGIIYRDAKPENILLTETYHIKLTDFGLSKWLKLGSTTKTMCGTFQYMAPEVLRGEPYGHAVDWWALGVIACQMFVDRATATMVSHGQQSSCFMDDSMRTSPKYESLQFVTGELETIVNVIIIQSPDIKPFLNAAPGSVVSADVGEGAARSLSTDDFLPPEVESLPHEGRDVVRRLLELEPKQRIRSVLALQKIALYKNYKIDSKHLLSISPVDIILRDNVAISRQNLVEDDMEAFKTFQGF